LGIEHKEIYDYKPKQLHKTDGNSSAKMENLEEIWKKTLQKVQVLTTSLWQKVHWKFW